MCIHTLPYLRDYCKDARDLGVPEYFAKVMPRNRILDVNRYLHLNDNSKMSAHDSPDADKLFKPWPFIESLHLNKQVNTLLQLLVQRAAEIQIFSSPEPVQCKLRINGLELDKFIQSQIQNHCSLDIQYGNHIAPMIQEMTIF